MGPDQFVHDVMVNGAERRRLEKQRDEVIEQAWTLEADAWNRLASISNLHELNYLTIPGISLEPSIRVYSRELSTPDDIMPFQDFRFRRIQAHGTLCQQWELL